MILRQIKVDRHRGTSAFALVLTLIILTLTAITVLAFLTTTTTERANAGGYGQISKATLFADAGVEAAISRITTEMQYRPYHAIGYRSVSVGNSLTEVIPVITGPRTTNPGTATYNTAPDTGSDVYLVSGTGSSPNGPPGSLAPSNLDATNSIELNSNRVSTEPKGWIGSPITAATPIPYRAPWVDILRDPGKTPQPNPSAANYNPVIGRYAYWIEDETSKIDSSLVGNKDNNDAFIHGDGVNSPPRMAVSDIDLGALPLSGGSPLPANDKTVNKAILDFRATQPIPDARFLNRVTNLSSDVHETTKFYETSFSLSNDLSGTGRRRANLNGLVTNTSDPGAIAGNIDDIAYVITGTHLMPTPTSSTGTLGPLAPAGARIYEGAPATTNALTNFGSRFFTSSTATQDQSNMYVERIAANVRDYIDTDSYPTYIDKTDQVISNVKPAAAWIGGTEPRAIGKEAIPYLQELAWYGFERKMQKGPPPTPPNEWSASYDVDIDFYFEFVNPTTKDFTAPAGAFLKVFNHVSWRAGSYPPLLPPDAEYSIAGIKFPAGMATVLTTVPDPTLDPPGLILAPNNVVRISGGKRNFVGQTDEQITNSPGLQFDGRPILSNPRTTDYSTEALWGTTTGIYEALGYVYSGGSGTATNWNMDTNDLSEVGSKTRFVYSASLRGNDDDSRTGDVRSLSEQLQMLGGASSLGFDQTRFYTDILGNGIPQNTTLGKVAQPKYVDPTKWPDYTPQFADNAATAPGIIRDDAMQSIGELGYTYDPVRTIEATAGPGNPAPSILQARGGGRTLKIGQMDDRIAGNRFSTSWFNASWRLADLFSAEPKDSTGNYPKVSPPTSRGKININGVLRDDGVAFKAALRNFAFFPSPRSDTQLSGNSLTSSEIDQLTSEVKTYLTANGPFMERGEISQLNFFNSSGTTKETAAGKTLDVINDRGREEIFRRCVEMITTRSASFTVYAVGQAIRQDKSGTKTSVGEKRLATTFQLEPRKAGKPLQESTVNYDVADNYVAKRVYELH
ncbi:MAG TPA: hypothetical protein VGM62_03830 [Chthoniobacterales bacterium]|jgi:hypothetical protein